MSDCLAGDGCFGVVLIARGSEVGGGDERVTVGTMAAIEHAEPAADGRWFVVASGRQRLRVRRWLGEDPYPRAVVEDDPGAPEELGDALRVAEARDPAGAGPGVRTAVSQPQRRRRWRWATRPRRIAWRLCALAPVGEFDRQRLLETPDSAQRLALLITLVREAGDDLRRILAGG